MVKFLLKLLCHDVRVRNFCTVLPLQNSMCGNPLETNMAVRKGKHWVTETYAKIRATTSGRQNKLSAAKKNRGIEAERLKILGAGKKF